MNTNNDRQVTHNMIDHIFHDLLPARGMAERREQTTLSHHMLDALLDGSIALCDAGTGIGKTYAYLAAGAVFLQFCTAGGQEFRPIVISTSSIALQNAVQTEFHADESLTVTGGSILITESYEGLEALHLKISGGDITLTAADDGLNAAGGADGSGFGGPHGGDRFGGRGGMGSSSSNGTLEISGGNLYIKASGDGIDANGTLTITGGYIIVCGPTQGDTATLDYDISGTISGGTFIGTGASGMAQTFSDSEQGVIALRTGNQAAGTLITLTDASGNTILSHTPELPFAVIILSSPDMIKGETYTVVIGTSSGDFTAS